MQAAEMENEQDTWTIAPEVVTLEEMLNEAVKNQEELRKRNAGT